MTILKNCISVRFVSFACREKPVCYREISQLVQTKHNNVQINAVIHFCNVKRLKFDLLRIQQLYANILDGIYIFIMINNDKLFLLQLDHRQEQKWISDTGAIPNAELTSRVSPRV